MAQHDDRTPMAPSREHNTTAARQGVTLGAMRYVLAISLLLAVAALAVTWLVLRG